MVEKLFVKRMPFLAAAKGVSVGIEFQRKIGAGFFGGEGFLIRKQKGTDCPLFMQVER